MSRKSAPRKAKPSPDEALAYFSAFPAVSRAKQLAAHEPVHTALDAMYEYYT